MAKYKTGSLDGKFSGGLEKGQYDIQRMANNTGSLIGSIEEKSQTKENSLNTSDRMSPVRSSRLGKNPNEYHKQID